MATIISNERWYWLQSCRELVSKLATLHLPEDVEVAKQAVADARVLVAQEGTIR